MPQIHILIPYRDRKSDLAEFLKIMPPIFDNFQWDWKIHILEQSTKGQFNRGRLLNIGFLENQSCEYVYILHDIDMYPKSQDAMKLYQKSFDEGILGIITSEFTIGGIIKFTRNTFIKINGFPNDYWGWGFEDYELQLRAEYYKIPIKKNIIRCKNGSQHFIIRDSGKRDTRNAKSKDDFIRSLKTWSSEEKQNYFQNNGLTKGCNYQILSQKFIDPDQKISHSIFELL